jgi:hypothetical protein
LILKLVLQISPLLYHFILHLRRSKFQNIVRATFKLRLGCSDLTGCDSLARGADVEKKKEILVSLLSRFICEQVVRSWYACTISASGVLLGRWSEASSVAIGG